MSFALELRGVSKQFVVGAAGCTATVHALRDVDLEIRPGEVVAVAGSPGAGKSTLFLCAAGLLRADSGDVLRFGGSEREAAISRATYHFASAARAPLSLRGTRPRDNEPHIHLIDGRDARRVLTDPRSRRWVRGRCAAGDAVLVALEAAAHAGDVVSRVIILRGGKVLATQSSSVTRVAEPARRSS